MIDRLVSELKKQELNTRHMQTLLAMLAKGNLHAESKAHQLAASSHSHMGLKANVLKRLKAQEEFILGLGNIEAFN